MLTDLQIKALKAPSTGRLEVRDGRLRGLMVRVTTKGIKSFVVVKKYRGKVVRITLGRYPEMRLADARKKAMEVFANFAKGIDPRESAQADNIGKTFEKDLDDFVAYLARREAAGEITKRYACEVERILRKEFVDAFRGRILEAIKKAEVMDVVYGVLDRQQRRADGSIRSEESPSAANHTLTAIKTMFGWAEGHGRIEQDVIVRLKSPAPKNRRKRTLSDEELVTVWNGSVEVGGSYENIIHLLILTAQRRSEVASLRKELVDLEKKVWLIPGDENKSGRDSLVPLCPVALEIIRSAWANSDELLFPSIIAKDKVFSGWSKSKIALDEICQVEGWVVHDLRRTASTNFARLSVRPDIKERVLNHAIPGVEGTYDRHDYLDQKREALELLEGHVSKLLD